MEPSKISQLLQKINTAVQNPRFPDISTLEMDLLKQHVRNFYELLDTPAQTSVNTTVTVAETVVSKETVVAEPVVVKKQVIKPNDDLFIKETVAEPKVTAPVNAELTTPVVETAPLQKEVVAEAKPSISPSVKPEVMVEKTTVVTSTTINSSYKTQGSLNEKLKTVSSTEIHKKLAVKPLKELIDLNKRFVLVNEFFKGNSDAYTAAITHIDTLPDYEAALAFVSAELAWDESKQSTRMLSKLIRLKFGVE